MSQKLMTQIRKNSRRDFLKQSALIGGAAVAGLHSMRVHAAEAGPLKIGLIGCGGRGCGAATDSLKCAESQTHCRLGHLSRKSQRRRQNAQ